MTSTRKQLFFFTAFQSCSSLRVTPRSSLRVSPRAPLHTTSHRDSALRYNPRNGWDDDESGPDIPSTDLFAGYAADDSAFLDDAEDPFCDGDDATPCVDAAAFWDLDASSPSVGGDAVLDAADPFCDAEDAAPDCVDGDAFWAIEAEPDYGAVDSHTIVERDAATGAPLRTAFSFVDERACVGCNACASISPSTFFMEDEHGMARVFRQHGDADEVIEEAVGACPVSCIKTVTYDALERLEVQRRDQVINAAGRNSLRAEGMAPRTIIPASALVDTADPAFVEEELRRETERQRKARRALGTGKDRIVEL
ncbi:ferredoxin I [Aureococcus anophagefferens]|uniref:Ferredoxin I n=1 Tax=Aureococcus anophagefferens TaxID=44056 RepID=A0ABR1GAP1_AURAN